MSDTFHIHNKLRILDSLCSKDLLLSCMYCFKLFIPQKYMSKIQLACLLFMSRRHNAGQKHNITVDNNKRFIKVAN